MLHRMLLHRMLYHMLHRMLCARGSVTHAFFALRTCRTAAWPATRLVEASKKSVLAAICTEAPAYPADICGTV